MADLNTTTQTAEPSPFLYTPAQLAALPHDNLGPRLDAVNWTLTVMAGIFLGLRLYCKMSSRRSLLWWDDAVLMAAWLSLVASTAVNSASVKLDYGKHVWDVNLATFVPLLLLGHISGTFAILAAVWSKMSFAITLLRITHGWSKATVWWVIISMGMAMHLAALLQWIQCTPIEKSWNPILEGYCYPLDRIIEYNMFSSAYSAAMDIALALMPWKIVWAARLKRSEKIGVALAMSMGIFAGITAFIKVSQVPRMKSGDIYDGVELTIWSTAEIAVTIMATSVPVLRALLGERKTTSKSHRPYTPDNFDMQSHSTTVIQAGHDEKETLSRNSRASPLADAEPRKSTGSAIVRTSIVTVVFESQNESGDAPLSKESKS